MLIHRGIVLDGKNYNMVEMNSTYQGGYDDKEIIATLGLFPDFDTDNSTTSYSYNYNKIHDALDKLNWVLVNTIGWDMLYQLYVNNEHTLVFRDSDGNPVITFDFSDTPKMWYATYNIQSNTGGTTDLGDTSYSDYDLDSLGGVKFRMLASATGGNISLTATRHRDGRTHTYSIPPKKYFVDDFWLNRANIEEEDPMWRHSVRFGCFITDDDSDSDKYGYFNAKSLPTALAHEVYTGYSTNRDELGFYRSGCSISWVDNPYVPNEQTLKYDVIYWTYHGFDLAWDSSNVNFESYIIPEVGYMNELENRFSPRYMSNGIGMYIIPQQGYNTPEEVSGIRDVARSLMETNVTSAVSGMFSQGKECVLGVRWYYGLKDKIEALKSTDLYDISVGGQRLSIQDHPVAPTIYMHAHYAKGEFVLWKTSKLNVPAHFNNYLDFCTSYKLYLPYYGFMDIDANDIVGGTIQVFYNINIVTGATMITVACNNSRSGNEETKYYSVSTEVGHTIPFGVDIMQSEGLRAANMIMKVGSMLPSLAMGGAQIQAGMQVNQANKLLEDIGNEPGTDTSKITAARDDAQNRYNKTNTMQSLVKDFDINAQKVSGSGHSTGVSNETGNLDELHPYLLITRPVNVEPVDYEDYVGLPSSQALALSQCSGFTQVAAVKPQSMIDAPKYFNEIMSLLQAGVYL